MTKKIVFLFFFSLIQAVPCFAQLPAKHALVFGLGEQLDASWGKINGDRDIDYIVEKLAADGYTDIVTLKNSRATNALVSSTGTAVNAVQNPQDPNQQFQIKRNSSGYQLYSVGAGGYAVYQSIFNVQFDSDAGSKLTITETGNPAYPWKLQLGDYYLNAQDEGQCSTGLRVDTWSYTDAGNSYILEEVVTPVSE